MNQLRQPRSVHREISRHGLTKYFYRSGKGPRIRLPGEFGTPEFWKAVEAARSRSEQLHVLPPKPPVEARRKQLIERALKAGVTRAAAISVAHDTPYDLTLDWALDQVERTDFRCALSGVPFFTKVITAGGRHPFAPSLDRIKPGGAYLRENVRVITFAMNVMLFDWGAEVFELTANGYRARRRGNEAATSIPEP